MPERPPKGLDREALIDWGLGQVRSGVPYRQVAEAAGVALSTVAAWVAAGRSDGRLPRRAPARREPPPKKPALDRPPKGLDAEGLIDWGLGQLRAGATQREVAAAAGVGVATVARWVASVRLSSQSSQSPGPPAPLPAVAEDVAIELVSAAIGSGRWGPTTARKLAASTGYPLAEIERFRLRALAEAGRSLEQTGPEQRAELLLKTWWWQHRAAQVVDLAQRAGPSGASAAAAALGQFGRAVAWEARLRGVDADRIEVTHSGGVEVLTPEQLIERRVEVARSLGVTGSALALLRRRPGEEGEA